MPQITKTGDHVEVRRSGFPVDIVTGPAPLKAGAVFDMAHADEIFARYSDECRRSLAGSALPSRVRIADEIETVPAHLAADIRAERYGMAYHTSAPMPLHPSAGRGDRIANRLFAAVGLVAAVMLLAHLLAR